MKLWAKTEEFKEGKFLVVRRDGTIPAWPHFVIGARDPCASAALTAYARHAEHIGLDPEYTASVKELSFDFHQYRMELGDGDPDAGPHRTDDPGVIAMMRGELPFAAAFEIIDQQRNLIAGLEAEIEAAAEKSNDGSIPGEQWAVVELMGHRVRTGIVSEVERFGTKMLRIDLPAEEGFVTEFYGGPSIYGIRPVSEEVGRAAAARSGDPRPVRPAEFRSLPSPDNELGPQVDEDDAMPF